MISAESSVIVMSQVVVDFVVSAESLVTVMFQVVVNSRPTNRLKHIEVRLIE